VWRNKISFSQDAQKDRPARPQAEQEPEAYPQGYVEDSCELRTPLAGFFSILLSRKGEFGHFRLLDPLLHQYAHIEHPFDLLNVIESGFRTGVRWGEE
jgi:hypothetical protein